VSKRSQLSTNTSSTSAVVHSRMPSLLVESLSLEDRHAGGAPYWKDMSTLAISAASQDSIGPLVDLGRKKVGKKKKKNSAPCCRGVLYSSA
jgi:hypothetical protein